MKLFFGILLAIISSLLIGRSETSPDSDTFFAYPRAIIVMESGSTTATVKCSKNYRVPDKQNRDPIFQSGTEFENGISVTYEFVRRTEYGDVYLFVIEEPGKAQNVIPLVFKGKPQTIIASKALNVRILPHAPDKKSG